MEKRIHGFTLIELLAGMAILSIMVVFLARIFSDGANMWKLGNKRIESNMDGRTAVEFIVRELSGMVADDRITMKLVSDDPRDGVLGVTNDRIYFVTMDNKAEVGNNNRQAIQIAYRTAKVDVKDASMMTTNRWRLIRTDVKSAISSSYQCYTNDAWWSDPTAKNTMESFGFTLIENVRAFDFWVYDSNGVSYANYDSRPPKLGFQDRHGPPAYIEVCVEVMGQDDAIKAANLTGAQAIDFANRASRRYIGRAYLNGRAGYVLAK